MADTAAPSIFGYFDDPMQEQPVYDPGYGVPCPCCLLPLGEDVALVCVSLMGEHARRSYFFRAHKACWRSASPEEQQRIEGSIIDAEAAEAKSDG